MNLFFICPVRGHDPLEYQSLVKRYEGMGHKVHWPTRDTNQDDFVGLRICEDNRAAIEAADAVVIAWDGNSQGVLFDAGMAFALRKPVIIDLLPPPTRGKGFQNMFRAWRDKLEMKQ